MNIDMRNAYDRIITKNQEMQNAVIVFLFLKYICKQMTRKNYIKLLPVFESRLVHFLLFFIHFQFLFI